MIINCVNICEFHFLWFPLQFYRRELGTCNYYFHDWFPKKIKQFRVKFIKYRFSQKDAFLMSIIMTNSDTIGWMGGYSFIHKLGAFVYCECVDVAGRAADEPEIAPRPLSFSRRLFTRSVRLFSSCHVLSWYVSFTLLSYVCILSTHTLRPLRSCTYSSYNARFFSSPIFLDIFSL